MFATLYIMIGPPGCGKSYYAAKLHSFNGAKIISSDDIRKKLYGDETVQKNSRKVFDIAHFLIMEELREGRSVIFDATNVIPDHRVKFMHEVESLKQTVYICGLVYRGTLTECLQRNADRERTVPEDVVRKMWTQLSTYPPSLSEGFDILAPLNDKAVVFVRHDLSTRKNTWEKSYPHNAKD